MFLFAEDSMISLGTAISIVSPVVIAVTGGLIFLFRAYILAKDKIIEGLEKEKTLLQEKSDKALAEKEAERKEEEALKKIFAEVGAEAVRSAFDSNNQKRKQDGKSPLALLAPIVSEGQSPPTSKQMEAARAGTMRAALAAIKLDAGQEPRKEPGTVDDLETHLVEDKPKPSDAIRAVLETQAATGVADEKAKHATELAVKMAKVAEETKAEK